MTRENKLALIVGFSLLLVVAVLLADHLSPAQQGEMATLDPGGGGAAITLPPGSGDQIRRQFGEPSVANGDPGESGGLAANREITIFRPPQEALQTQMGGANTGSPSLGGAADDIDRILDSGPADHIDRPGSGAGDQPEVIHMGGPIERVLPPSQGEAADTRPGRRYIIEDGDTLYGLCRTFYGDGSLHEALMKHNSDVVPASGRLRIGMTLVIPSKEVLTGRSEPPPVRAQAAAPTTSVPRTVRTTDYTIREDDRLWDIARKHLGKGGRWQEIVALNRDIIKNPDVLPIGKTIRIPAR